MKLYRTPTGHWAGAKDDAALLAKTHDTTFEPYEVPYDKASLLAFLNDFKVGAENTATVVQTVIAEKPAPVVSETMQKVWDRMAIEEAILLAPLDTALALGELVMSRMRDFARSK